MSNFAVQPVEIMGRSSVATDFVDAALQLRGRDQGLWHCDPDMPEVMRDPDHPPTEDWIPWQPIPSTVSDQDIAELEAHFGGTLPPAYVAFLRYVHFVELTEIGIRFESHIPGQWKEDLIAVFDANRPYWPTGYHLVPFGYETRMDAGPICFDFANRQPNGDCAVVIWDIGWVYSDQDNKVVISSSAAMYRSVHFNATTRVGFWTQRLRSDVEDPVAERERLLAEFFAIDPEGAGGPAREYWRGWQEGGSDASQCCPP